MRILFCLLTLSPFAFAQVPPEKALATMKAADGLQVELFAAEPMVINPTNMDIDPLGRVWITEAVNYRTKLHNKPLNRPEGDRIVILTDTKGVGKADEMTVFYQGKELYGPLGICIVPFVNKDAKHGIGYRVLVSQSPDILEFWDKDGDGKADGPPTKFLSGFGGFDHDHGVHSIQVGPDGKFYFTVGDAGFKDLKSSDGKQNYSQNRTTMQAGTIWRCDPDGNNLELIAHNFRNEYEACVDSFGEIWCSDNDDDGNQQTRICYVMPGGNYGYWPRGKGESHWHEEQPGIVPKVLRTGFGSPCGICCYEGSLLPEKYRGQLLHVDAGPREVRCFHKKPKGAGYELEKSLMLTSTDNWFRPSDVCVAPDGSVFVCDWYDPGVGGHGMGDTTRGRVYRITPKGHDKYMSPSSFQLSNNKDFATAFRSGCITNRILGHDYYADVLLKNRDEKTHIEFHQEFDASKSDSIRIRKLWCILMNLDVLWKHEEHSCSRDNYIRIVSETQGLTSKNFWNQFARMQFNDWTIAARRQLALELHTEKPDRVAEYFYKLAPYYDGQDRFYLAALNIACGTDPERRDKILADFDKHFPEWNDKVADLVWELRPKCMMPKLDGLLKDAKLTPQQKARIVEILATSDDANAGKSMLALLSSDHPAEVKAKAIESLQFYLPTKWKTLQGGPELKAAIAALLKNPATRVTGLQLVAAVRADDQLKEVIGLTNVGEGVTIDIRLEALRTLGRLRSLESVATLLHNVKDGGVSAFSEYHSISIRSLGQLIESQAKDEVSQKALAALEQIVSTTAITNEPRKKQAAIDELAGVSAGANWLIKLKQDGKFPEGLESGAGILLRNSPFRGVIDKAKVLFPAAAKMDLKTLPSPAALARISGDAKRGRDVFLSSFKGDAQCMKCHTVHKEGGAIGPDLSAIGKKASRENLFESILFPSRAIADQYTTWKVDTSDGQSITGLLVKETPTEITLRDANGKDYVLAVKNIEKKAKSVNSLMAEDIAKALTEQELIDLVEYLYSLKE